MFFLIDTVYQSITVNDDSSFRLWTSNSLIQVTVFRNSSEAMNGFSSSIKSQGGGQMLRLRIPAAENQLPDAGHLLSSGMRFSNSTCRYSSGNTSAETDEQNLAGLPLHRAEIGANHDFLAFNEGDRT